MIDPTGATAASSHATRSTKPAARHASRDFAGELATFVAKPTGVTTTKAPARPDGEQTKKVAGHHYARIENGTDKGKFLNQLAGSPREGSVFEIVKRANREFHVYGTGKDRVVVELKASGQKTPASSTSSSTGGAAPATT
jgi:hypothetical protein